MNVSAILVVVPVAEIDSAVEALGALSGVEVHHTDRATGRIIVTQEAETISAEVDGLARIKRLPRVILAELVHHHFEEDREVIEGLPAELEQAGPLAVPRSLED